MRAGIRSVKQAVELLVEYNDGRRTAEEEEALVQDGQAYAGARLSGGSAHEQYYLESEAIKYDLLDWHFNTTLALAARLSLPEAPQQPRHAHRLRRRHRAERVPLCVARA